MTVQQAVLPKNKGLEGMTVGEIAKAQGKGIIDAFLDLVVEENLDTAFLHGENNVDDEAVAKILNYPNAIIGLSDGGAHVQFQSGFGFSTRLLGEWVREKKIMSLETAVRRLTFESASVFGLHDRGLLQPGMVADIVIFDPDTVRPLPHEVVHDFPTGAMRIREPAQGIHMTVVNGQVLLEDGKHSGALPGRVLRNPYYRANHRELSRQRTRRSTMALTLEEANRIIEGAVAKARELNIRISVAVCDAGGRLVAFQRMNNAIWASAYGSQGKAIASAAFGRPSGELSERANHPTPAGIAAAEGGHMIMGQGAVPILREGAIEGACGVGGGTAQQDEDCAAPGSGNYKRIPACRVLNIDGAPISTTRSSAQGFPILTFAPAGLQSVIDVWNQASAPINPTTEFAANFRVIAMDQRNAGGQSSRPDHRAGRLGYATPPTTSHCSIISASTGAICTASASAGRSS